MSLENKTIKPEIHVLLVAFSAQGHINPLLRLGKSLLTKGFNVTLATTELVYHRVFKSTTTSTTADNAVPASYTTNGINVLFFSDGFDITQGNKSPDEYMDLIAEFGPISLTNLIKNNFLNNTNKKLACIINNPFVPWVTNVASEFNIPCACLWIQPCTLYSIYYRFYNKLNQFPTLENPEIDVELPGLPLLKPQDLPSFVLPSNPFGALSNVLAEMFQDMKKLKWVLANSFYELEKDVIDSMAEIFPIKTVGPLVPPSLLGQDQTQDVGIEMWKSQDSCIEWLNQKPPSSVIYISFGSLIFLSEKQMQSIAEALKNSKSYFLWVMKSKEREEPIKLPEKFLEETKEKGMVVSWCPQTKVLVHPAIACFLTHCGWNSMLEAITAGVPMIAYPQWTDQPTNAKLVSDVFGMGIRLKQDSDGFVESEEVERAIGEIVGERFDVFKKNAVELKVAAREAVADGGSSDRNIQEFVDEILASVVDDN
ncbi:UDP-glycosyltransferase 84B2-like protein [Trifolium pratense]|uniref:Glycosyltransferase n=1 Tax=Trifolium pratense TaxID=57577 RepID=A0A2K3N515_TRIPR|nr:UDP-glycosyltransferase 84B2-like protein [Trifolium pratense]